MALAAVSVVATAAVPTLVPFALAIGPAIIALALARKEGNGADRRLLAGLVRRPARAAWYLVVALPLAWAAVTVVVGVALGHRKDDLFGAILPGALIVPVVVLIPALAEELAWRGFAVGRLTSSISPLGASLVLAVPWTVMHLVLLLPGAVNEGVELWPAVVSLTAYSVLLTWIFVGSGSILLAALVHAGLNGVVPLMSGIEVEASWAIRAVVAAAIAIAVVTFGGFRRRDIAPQTSVA
jgi:membrane protease YdiL (CAAX protease family)